MSDQQELTISDAGNLHDFLPECTYREGPGWNYGVCVCPELQALQARIAAAHEVMLEEAFAAGYAACARQARQAVLSMAGGERDETGQGSATQEPWALIRRDDVLASLDLLPGDRDAWNSPRSRPGQPGMAVRTQDDSGDQS